MTNQEKEALLKRIYSLPTEWADGGGSYGKGGPVGSEDAAMLWPEDVIDAISQFAEDNPVTAKQPDTMISLEWVKTTDRLPTKDDADDEGKVTALITGMLTGKLLSLSLYYASVTAESADYFLPMPKLPEVEE